MGGHPPRRWFLVAWLLLLIVVSACSTAPEEGDGSAPSTASGQGSICQDLERLAHEIKGIRGGTIDPATGLADLADLESALRGDAQVASGSDAESRIGALADQIYMVVQRNTLEGVGTNDPGTDPTVNMEKLAKDAGAVSGCPGP